VEVCRVPRIGLFPARWDDLKKESEIIETAGFTAAQSIDALESAGRSCDKEMILVNWSFTGVRKYGYFYAD